MDYGGISIVLTLNMIKTVILGIVEGFTEWLPISSTGHLVLVGSVLKLDESKAFIDMFNYVIQFGAIMAVVILYFHKLNPFSPRKNQLEQKQTWTLWFKVIVAVIPSVIIGFPLNDWMDEHLMKNWIVASMLILYGVLFIVIENRNKHTTPKFADLNTLPWLTAFWIGCFQALSIIPGTSRSGATILGAIILGTSRFVGAEFSFFMAIPTMVGVAILKIGKFLYQGNTFTGDQSIILLVGMLVSFIVSIISIKFLMDYIKKHDFKVFGWYRIILGLLVLGAMLFA
ncbi:undecaprenyl-diphosphate phosphatase [Latilactobacillus curvatus]|uniref:undecaprenyl-diphosphate phosphatase n=2 Tax=Latilactobacillus curvatus TaxID=28038 RepID=UPI00097556CF|nr:undecaprenyl-diphosphate phosphatase [Latilactobacillus curvatus]UTB70853.1 undecaprenyl-diphosphatase [Latilactobacillus curvatus]UTB73871.1 undecaprenyl-diphosphatase [Latilactobacillus curvatus]UTC10934.1 undecaprenyl-diphosphatase [Latilactobacillus curvatus]UTY79771.1 undecaprenyl-diphosphatase [Latilactobacillus curvatus]